MIFLLACQQSLIPDEQENRSHKANTLKYKSILQRDQEFATGKKKKSFQILPRFTRQHFCNILAALCRPEHNANDNTTTL